MSFSTLLMIGQGFVRAYTSILENAPPSYSLILRHLAYKASEPLIIHCTAGKDRTGVICALVLSLCGVDDAVIAEEYSLTEVGLSQEWKKAVIQHLMSHPALDGNTKGAENMIGAKYSSPPFMSSHLLTSLQGCEHVCDSQHDPREVWQR